MEFETGSNGNQTVRVKTKKGGLKTMPFIIANETFEKVATIGLNANMILYMTSVYHMDIATGACVLFLWSAVSNFMPLIGAVLSDSYFGRFCVIAFGSIFGLLGLTMLLLTAIVPQATPPHCSLETNKCVPADHAQLAFLYFSFALMSIGTGFIRPCSMAFGADQMQKADDPRNGRIIQSYINWYYASVGTSIMISVTAIVYVQNKAGWIVGFGVPVGLMLLSTILFLLGSPLYVKVKANKSLIIGFFKVIVAAWKKRHMPLPTNQNVDGWYYQTGSKLIAPTERLGFFNRACLITNQDEDNNHDGKAKESWRLCTVKQVEELKALIKVLPIWSTTIMVAININQVSFNVLQASTMDRHFISSFQIPAGSYLVFGISTMTLWVAMFDLVIVPRVSNFTKNPRGLGLKLRMGTGVFLACIANAVAAMVERKRRNTAIQESLSDNPYAVVSMSAMWLVPQYCISGLAEAFNIIGQIEFYYSQFPKSMSSIGMALVTLGIGVGSIIGSAIVKVVNEMTQKHGKISWFSSNINKGHLDYYYWLLTALGVGNFFYFLLCSWFYGTCEEQTIWDELEDMKEDEEIVGIKESLGEVSV